MKFRRNKIKREHSIIDGALEWLEDLSKKKEVTDIIPGVIDVTHSKERGIVYKYETPTGCKLFLKSGGSIQEVFVVTEKPEVVQQWTAGIMEELSFFQTALDNNGKVPDKERKTEKESAKGVKTPRPGKQVKNKSGEPDEILLTKRDNLLAGIKEEYQLVEINQGLRDSFVESLASMADLDNPKLEDALEPEVRDALESLAKKK